MDVQSTLTSILALCGAISVVGGAVAIVYKGYKQYRKPSDDNSRKIAEHDKDIHELKEHVQSDYESIKEIKKLQSSMGLALVRIMDHLLYGDHNTELERAKDELWELLAKSK